jgi:fermentation-respiration switch protein FrsA (DUF1100 family)
VIERYFIYFPARPLLATPAAAGLEFEDLQFRAADGTRLHGWLVPGGGEASLLWFHGNAGNISHRVELLRELHDHLEATIFILEYRGYGDSEGTPSEEGLYLDAEAALKAMTSHAGIPAEQVVLFGQSLGAAVAVELATRQVPSGLVLESAFTSVRDMARHHYPWLPVASLLRNRFDSLSKIERAKTPLLMIHGENDRITPLRMGEALFGAAREPKRFQLIQGADHNDVHLLGRREYFAALRQFLSELRR